MAGVVGVEESINFCTCNLISLPFTPNLGSSDSIFEGEFHFVAISQAISQASQGIVLPNWQLILCSTDRYAVHRNG